MKIKGIVVGIAVLLLVMVASALAADPTDTSFGTKGIAEIEASLPEGETDGFEEGLGSIVDLEPDGHGKLLAAVGPIPGSIKNNHFFAASRILSDGHPDPGFDRDGLTRRRRVEIPNGEGGAAGVLRAEAVAPVKGGKVLLAGFFDDGEAYAPSSLASPREAGPTAASATGAGGSTPGSPAGTRSFTAARGWRAASVSTTSRSGSAGRSSESAMWSPGPGA